MGKNKKGQTVGTFIVLILGIITCVVLLVAVAQQKGNITDTIAYENVSVAANVVNGTTQYVTQCRALNNVLIFNATGDIQIPSTNYTLTNNVVYNGQLAVSILPNALDDADFGYNAGKWTIDGTCEPLTYDENSAGRTIIDLVVLLSALALVVFVLEKSGVTNLFGRD